MKERCGVELTNDDVYMATTYEDFVKAVVVKSRGGGEAEFTYDAVSMIWLKICVIYLILNENTKLIIFAL